MDFPKPAVIDLDGPGGVAKASVRIIKLYKQCSTGNDPERFIEHLEQACDTARPNGNVERCFLNWDEAREMQNSGMAFGSHTDGHDILSKLPVDRQREEAERSRQILERELGGPIDVMAYPVGAPYTFSGDTQRVLQQTGYRGAFSMYRGVNRRGDVQPFDIRRCPVDAQSRARLRFQTAFSAFTGERWI
jgi:hypothetical protein